MHLFIRQLSFHFVGYPQRKTSIRSTLPAWTLPFVIKRLETCSASSFAGSVRDEGVSRPTTVCTRQQTVPPGRNDAQDARSTATMRESQMAMSLDKLLDEA
jgi:hypothetical protein